MASNKCPSEYREFDKIVDKMGLQYGYHTVFHDWLQYCILYLSTAKEPDPIKEFKAKYGEKEQALFYDMFKIMIQTNAKHITEENDWHDFPGGYYEYIATTSQKSGFGQFFTPEHVVDLMVLMQGKPGEHTAKKMKVNDPTCGSGRMLLSFHAKHPGNYMVAEDLDHTCVLMTVLNFMVHGVVGEVIHHNSLNPETYYKGYLVNNILNSTGCITVIDLPKEYSKVWQLWELRKFQNKNQKAEIKPDKGTPQQLKLF